MEDLKIEHFKVKLHFINNYNHPFLEDCSVIVDGIDDYDAMRKLLKYEWQITTRENERIWVNLNNVTYIECEKMREDENNEK